MLPVAERGAAADVVLVFLAAFGVRLLWAAITPPWLAPDEPAHFAYVTHLVENGEIPNPSAADPRYPEHSLEYQESCELTLCSELSGLGSGFGQRSHLPLEYNYSRARSHRREGDLRKTGAGSSATSYPALYYALAAVPYRALYDQPILTRLLGTRASSAWLSALACAFGYLFAFEIKKSQLWGRAVGLSLAFMPMQAFIGASVNNDAAMFAGTSALWWLLARVWFADKLSLMATFVVGATAGIAVLGKPTAAPVVVPAALLVVAKAIHSAKGWHFQRAAVLFASFGVGFAVPQSFRYLYQSTHASPVASGAVSGKSDVLKALLGEAKYSIGDYFRDLSVRGWSYAHWLFIKTFWGNFGWLEVSLSDATYTAIVLAIAASALGLLVRLWVRPLERPLTASMLAATAFNVVALFLAADYAMGFSARGSTFGMQGRYFFGNLVPLMFLLVSGLTGLLGERTWVLRAAPFLVVVLHITSILVMLQSYYSVSIG